MQKHEFLSRKTRTESELANENFKRTRGDKTSPSISNSSENFPKNNDKIQFKQSNSINKNLPHVSIPPSQPLNITQAIIKSAYNDNRLKSMSHIKQINPKYRNYIIPVLPGAFNKLSNI